MKRTSECTLIIKSNCLMRAFVQCTVFSELRSIPKKKKMPIRQVWLGPRGPESRPTQLSSELYCINSILRTAMFQLSYFCNFSHEFMTMQLQHIQHLFVFGSQFVCSFVCLSCISNSDGLRLEWKRPFHSVLLCVCL